MGRCDKTIGIAIHCLSDDNTNTIIKDSVYLYFFELPSDLERILIMLLVLDAILTGVIFFSGVGIIILIYSVNTGDWVGVHTLLEFLNAFILFRGSEIPIGILFYSTYFTSVWLYLFIAASIATKLLYSLGRTGNQVLALLKIEENPFNSMGLLLIGFLTLAFAIYAIIGIIV